MLTLSDAQLQSNRVILEELLQDVDEVTEFLNTHHLSYDDLVSNVHNAHKNIRGLCEKNHVLLIELAQHLGICHSTISKIVDGRKCCDAKILKEIADFIEIPVIELIIATSLKEKREMIQELLQLIDIEKNIDQLCSKYNLSFNKLAQRLGTSEIELRNYLRNTRQVSPYVVESIAKFFNISTEKLLLLDVNLYKNIRIFCYLKGFTLDELAKQTSLSPPNTSSIIRICKHPNFVTLKRIIQVLDISLENLVFGVPTEVEEFIVDKTNLGKNVRILMNMHRMTYSAISSCSSLEISTIRNILIGKFCSAHSVRKIANVFGLSTEDIIFGNFIENNNSMMQS